MEANIMPKYLTVEEVADILRVSPRTVRRLCTDHKLSFYYVGSQIRILNDDLQNYLSKQRKEVNENE